MKKYKTAGSGEQMLIWKDKSYLEAMQVKERLTDELLQNISEGNESQSLAVLEKRNALGIAGILRNENIEWKYEVLQLEGLIFYTLRGNQVLELFLDEVHSSFIEKINAANNVIACCEVMKETLKEYCRTKKYHSTCSNSVLVQKIQAAVDLDLTQPLTLQYFSEKLNVNSSYLSSLFKKETGETITEYVTRRRLEHASGLLLNSSYPVHTIAELTGIADVHYFCKLFKKYKGETPSQYRERLHAQ